MQLVAKELRRDSRPLAHVGDLPIDAVRLEETAQAFVDYCLSDERANATRPLYSTSANGQVISMCAHDRDLAQSILAADSVNADGQALVILSRRLCASPLPERVATTDLFPAVARLAAPAGVTFYMLGGEEEVNRRAVAATRAAYPGCKSSAAATASFRAPRRRRSSPRSPA